MKTECKCGSCSQSSLQTSAGSVWLSVMDPLLSSSPQEKVLDKKLTPSDKGYQLTATEDAKIGKNTVFE